jgi:hypothetical protein
MSQAFLIYTNVPNDPYPLWQANASYGQNTVVRDYTVEYGPINQIGLFLSTADFNSGNPTTDVTKWTRTGYVNHWKMFDNVIGSRTTNPWYIQTQTKLLGVCKSVGFLDVDALYVRVRVYNTAGTKIYDQLKDLVPSFTGEWLDYYKYSEIVDRPFKSLIFDDLPSVEDVTVDILIVAAPTGVASVGLVTFGVPITVGPTQYGTKVGINDFSTKEPDAFGNIVVTPRAFRSTADFQVMVNNTDIDKLKQLLSTYRSTPVFYVGTGAYSATMIYGFYRDFDIVIDKPTSSLCTITVEGLT